MAMEKKEQDINAVLRVKVDRNFIAETIVALESGEEITEDEAVLFLSENYWLVKLLSQGLNSALFMYQFQRLKVKSDKCLFSFLNSIYNDPGVDKEEIDKEHDGTIEFYDNLIEKTKRQRQFIKEYKKEFNALEDITNENLLYISEFAYSIENFDIMRNSYVMVKHDFFKKFDSIKPKRLGKDEDLVMINEAEQNIQALKARRKTRIKQSCTLVNDVRPKSQKKVKVIC